MDLLAKWCEYLRANRNRKPRTVTKYQLAISRLATYLDTHDRCLVTAEEEHLIGYVGAHCWHELKLTAAARKPIVAAVRMFYDFTHEHGYTPTNPAQRLEYPALSRKLPIAMALHNLERLMAQPDLTTFKGLRDLTMISIMAGMGFRVGGVVALNQENFRAYQDGNGQDRLAVIVTEKGEKERMIPVPMETQILVTAYLAHPLLNEIDRHTKNGQRVMFVTTHNRQVPEWEYIGEHRRISERAVDQIIKAYGEKAGLPKDECHAHALRHLNGTELAESDVSSLEIADLLGHASVDTTAIYAHIAMRKKTNTIDKANPLGKITTPVTGLLREFKKALPAAS